MWHLKTILGNKMYFFLMNYKNAYKHLNEYIFNNLILWLVKGALFFIYLFFSTALIILLPHQGIWIKIWNNTLFENIFEYYYLILITNSMKIYHYNKVGGVTKPTNTEHYMIYYWINNISWTSENYVKTTMSLDKDKNINVGFFCPSPLFLSPFPKDSNLPH